MMFLKFGRNLHFCQTKLLRKFSSDFSCALPRVLSSMVKIYTVGRINTEKRPWVAPFKAASTGSGFVISNRRIITNAHCVDGFTLVYVKKPLSGSLFISKVLHFGHICDLAILTVEDHEFWNDTHDLEILDMLPPLTEEVNIVGYPEGGDSVCITKGIVSRISAFSYGHKYYAELPVIQVDAAINSGNSGGPVFLGSKVIGVVFQKLVGAENVGFIIPSRIVILFLKCIELNLISAGFCSIGTYFQKMENKVLREYFSMGKRTGILVIGLLELSCLWNLVRRNDVLLEIDGIPIQNDGEVFCGTVSININGFIALKDIGEQVSLKCLRMGKEIELSVFVFPVQKADLVDFPPPTYYVYAGFVFTLADGEELKIAEVLESDVNMGYTMFDCITVLFVNGQKVSSLEHLSTIIQQAEEYVRLDLENANVVVINRKYENQSEIVSKIKAAGGIAVMGKLK